MGTLRTELIYFSMLNFKVKLIRNEFSSTSVIYSSSKIHANPLYRIVGNID